MLAQLARLGITTDFARMPCLSGRAFDASARGYRIRSREALCYLVERGPGPQSLDSALLAQARALGVEVRFNHRLARIAHAGILAVGPKAADAIAIGYHFNTTMEDGFWVICDDALAPKGYAYLLVMGGRGTVKSCMLTGFKQEAMYVKCTVEAFERLAGLKMDNPRAHGGVGLKVDEKTAKTTRAHEGNTFYFCSARCGAKFDADPGAYLSRAEPAHKHKPEPVHAHKPNSRHIHEPAAVSKTPVACYTCPMHPEVPQPGPGSCPKCGMALEPEVPLAAAATQYTCPMHPEIVRDEPGSCPKCGMAL